MNTLTPLTALEAELLLRMASFGDGWVTAFEVRGEHTTRGARKGLARLRRKLDLIGHELELIGSKGRGYRLWKREGGARKAAHVVPVVTAPRLTAVQRAYLTAIEEAGGKERWVNLDDIIGRLGRTRADSTHYNNLKRLRRKLGGRLVSNTSHGYRLDVRKRVR